ncbi:MAG: signal peptidase I [Phormidesmis priestleyi Ana]|uniref:Signal peptidase I n=1 Tax=Phormidesmis priestleyi Ana TaxID=1666911 RepID=A0A0P7ZL29_9CYAN|nr:MAG: signal peptidase I [Phormidesmis priestleyi Ana]
MRAQHPVRDCWLAVNLSGLMPGLGQCYGQQWIKGLLIMAVFFGLVIQALWSLLAAEGNTVHAFWKAGIAAIVYFLNIWDAFATSGQPLHPLGDKRRGRDLWYGVFLSQILPGLGQLYLNKALAGAVFLVVGVGLSMLANYQPVVLPMACTVWSIAGYHAYRSTPINPGREQSRSGQMLMVVVIGGLLLRLTIGSLPMWIDRSVMQCIVPSESMVPTLQVNDRIFVSRDRNYLPKTGDIVVFEATDQAIEIVEAEPQSLFVKRIVGLPGQEVEVKDQQVWINKRPLTESYITVQADYAWGPAVVPSESYFVLGDNRNASADSHVWGFLPRANLVGEAYKIYWPAQRIQSLQR